MLYTITDFNMSQRFDFGHAVEQTCLEGSLEVSANVLDRDGKRTLNQFEALPTTYFLSRQSGWGNLK